ncbi:MAG: class I SAM-dependent methyltransferase [Fibrobacterota bacterium]|nr:class I SAM-dependent methyltransferase [Fibrobacterota bacterium]
MIKTSHKEFLSMIREVKVIEKGIHVEPNEETKVYLDFHSDRYFKTYEFLKPFIQVKNPAILDFGMSPYFATVLQCLSNATYAGVWGGRRLDHSEAGKSELRLRTQLRDKIVETPVQDGYDFESDALPFPDQSFDIILFLEVIEHFIVDPIFALKEIARVLKPEGILILTTDNSNCLIKLLKFLALKPIYWPYNDTTYGDRHNREYLQYEIADLLKGIGYRDVQVGLKNLSPYGDGKHPLKKKIGYVLSNIITQLPYFRNFKRQIFASARRGESRDYYPGWLFMRKPGWIGGQN